MNSHEKEIRKIQRGMKTSHLIQFMRQFEPYRSTDLRGSNKSHCIRRLVRWIVAGWQPGSLPAGTSTPEQIQQRFERVRDDLTAFRARREAEETEKQRQLDAMNARFLQAGAEARARNLAAKRRIEAALSGTRLEDLTDDIAYGAHECRLPHDVLVQLVTAYANNELKRTL